MLSFDQMSPEVESMVEPDRITDNFGWELMTLIRYSLPYCPSAAVKLSVP